MDPEVQCRIHKDSPIIPILSRINLIPRNDPISLRSILILSSYLRLGLSKGVFPVGTPFEILKALLFCTVFFYVSTAKSVASKRKTRLQGLPLIPRKRWNKMYSYFSDKISNNYFKSWVYTKAISANFYKCLHLFRICIKTINSISKRTNLDL